MNRPNAFISHASSDKVFVRKLDAALSSNGVSVFLDERDIAIGESIPTRIAEGIAAASHLIYVVSERSKVSRWVEEELSIAKMREKAGRGIRILPLLLEPTELPVVVSHIRFADFTRWTEATPFSRAVTDLLIAMGVTPKAVALEDVRFWLESLDELLDMQVRLQGLASYIYGALEGDYHSSDDKCTWRGLRTAVKGLYRDGSFAATPEMLDSLRTKLSSGTTDVLAELYRVSEELGNILPREDHAAKNINYNEARQLHRVAGRLADMLMNFHLQTLAIAVSGLERS